MGGMVQRGNGRRNGREMRVLVVGGGGREHALCWALAASPLVSELSCAPGNAGIADIASCVDIDAGDIAGLTAFARKTGVELAVVGPEAPLAAGLADSLNAAGIAAFGPSAAAARLEASKSFARDLCARAGVPAPTYGSFTTPSEAKAYARVLGAPVVVKADGLAAGKGVRVCRSAVEADSAIDSLLGGALGPAGDRIVIEEFLAGEEISALALVHGTQVMWLTSAQDHKCVGEGDTGPNTGGMGAYSPAVAMTPTLEETVIARILRPIAEEMQRQGQSYRGVLFAGLMLVDGDPYVLEFNARFGDPECQTILPRLRSDLLTLIMATCEGGLDRVSARWTDEAALTVVLAAKGYPGAYERGSIIRGVEAAGREPDVTVFHAGTTVEGGVMRADGGRVLNVTAIGSDVAEARRRAYAGVDRIDWPEGFCRRDIGWRAVDRQS